MIIERVYQGAGDPGTTIIPPVYDDFHWEPPEDEAFTYDPDRAAELLDEAGYTVGDDGFRTMPNGDPIGTLRLYARSESPTSRRRHELLPGVAGRRRHQGRGDGHRVQQPHRASSSKGDFDAFEWGWFVEPDPSSMLSYMTCDQLGDWSDSWYCNEEYDALYEQQQTEIDPEARAEKVKQMQQMLLRGLAVPRHRVRARSARRSAATGSPACSRSRTPAGSS